MRENTARTTWREGGQTIGAWVSIGNAYTAETMAGMGFDWLCVDLQHGMLSYDDLKYMLPAISPRESIPLVRVPWNEPYEIMKALDAAHMALSSPWLITGKKRFRRLLLVVIRPRAVGLSGRFGPRCTGVVVTRPKRILRSPALPWWRQQKRSITWMK